MRMSLIIQMLLTIVKKNSEFVEETLGKLWGSKIYERLIIAITITITIIITY